jgi:hypothetical protein
MQCHYCENTIDSEGGIRLGESDLFFCHSCYITYQTKETKMKYYLDTEFIEGPQRRRFLGIHYANTKPTIDLISIGIVSEELNEPAVGGGTLKERAYYAISKDFNLKEAWNRYQIKQVSGDARNRYPEGIKEYWIRENVLKPIFDELILKESNEVFDSYERQFLFNVSKDCIPVCGNDFTYKNFKALINKYGKTNNEIAEEIKYFCGPDFINGRNYTVPEFYAYYADYDWVVFCWIFGKMIDLPKGFPWYCRDLKQNFDVLAEHLNTERSFFTPKQWVEMVKEVHPDYPKQTNEHNALDDARWNKALHNFLNNI